MPPAFRWAVAGGGAGTVSLVLLDAGYREIGRVDGIDGGAWRPDAAASTQLAAGGTFHWFVAGAGAARTWRSPLATFDVR